MNSYPGVTSLQASPSAGGTNGGTYLTSLTPTLSALAYDGESDTQRLDFEVEYDPAFTDGTGQVWTGSAAGLNTGDTGKVTVAAGKLADGKHYRWRVRAFDGTDYSRAWSAWQNFTVDNAAPAAATISLPPYPANAWSAKQAEAVKATLDTTSADGAGYYWGLDDPATPNLAEDNDGGGDPLQITLDPAQGWHTLYVKTRDQVLRTSTVTAYSFGAGVGEVTKPQGGDRTQSAITLSSRAAPDRSQVRYEYKADLESTGAWAPVPASVVTTPGSADPISGWPQTRGDVSKDFADLYWDAGKTMAALRRGDGPIALRACFPGAAEACSDPVTFTLERTAFGSSYAMQPLGPGTVALLTGDYAVDATDASIFGLSVARTHTALAPVTKQGAEGVFGPGWVASMGGQNAAASSMQFEDHSDHGYVLLIGADGAQLTYTVNAEGVFEGVSDATDGSYVTKNSASRFTHVDGTLGIKTVFEAVDDRWGVTRVDEPGSDNTTAYTHDGQGRITRILAPVPRDVDCSTGLVAGCKALDITYASATTATGVASGWGDYAGLVKQITFTAYDPDSAAMKTVVVAGYAYDSTGHLRTVTDPRTGLASTYYYTGEGRLSQVTPPGLAPWRMRYDAAGRVADVSRTTPQGEATEAVAYDIPIGGTAAPVPLTATDTAAWSQVLDLPRIGAAIFPASKVPARDGSGAYRPAPTDYPYGKLTYVDVNGRPVNTAVFGAGAWQIATTRFDDNGNTTWALSAGNRAQALAPTADTAPYVAGRASSSERADLLASVTAYDGDGNIVTADSPAHVSVLASGAVASARARTGYTYDEGAPAGFEGSGLVTTTVTSPLIVDGSAAPGAADVRTVKNGYEPLVSGDSSGWELSTPTSRTTVMPGASDLVERTRLDASGREVERRSPASSGTDAATTLTVYYTVGAHPDVAACGGKPEWAGMVCRTGPAAQPAGKPLPVTTTTYAYFGGPAVTTEDTGTARRTTTVSYDAAGRSVKSALTVTPATEGGSATPEITFTYDPSTGLRTQASDGKATVTSGFDSLGRVTTSTDADGNTSTTTYTLDGLTASVGDGKGVTTYTYDGTDALGKAERRGLITKIDTGGSAGVFTGAHDADGRLVTQGLPNGLTATSRYDAADNAVGLTYAKSGTTWLSFSALPDADGRVAQQSGPKASRQNYTYDAAGRLTKVADNYGTTCTTRVYAFSAGTNRINLSTYPGDDDGACSTATTPSTQSSSFDAADRITDSGYAYDAFGRTTQVPAQQVSGTTAVSAEYFSSDRLAKLTQGQQTSTYTLDPEGRVRSVVTSGGATPGTVGYHYASGADTPAWISEANGSWTRNISAFNGLAAIQRSDGSSVLQLANLHGDIVATSDAATTATGVQAYFEQTEYGAPRAENSSNPGRYGWLGKAQPATDAMGGLIHMGVRLYNPATSRFLQTDPIAGGSANAYEYAGQDPVNNADTSGKACYTSKRYTQNYMGTVSIYVNWCSTYNKKKKRYEITTHGVDYLQRAKLIYKFVRWQAKRSWLSPQKYYFYVNAAAEFCADAYFVCKLNGVVGLHFKGDVKGNRSAWSW
ncbi:RHS repeat-associated core domain-containing protein [Nonomuraea sp. NPDC049684]|uniref:RHS repeat-associated core domain-containing protein n=1 Tax=Nonomuraea sp. NPDC049684 TaxID=3364356 RepID=UPI00379DBA05